MDNWFKSHITSPVINHLGKRKECANFSNAPILIGGCGRSGTTLLLSILSAHPCIFALNVETDAFTQWERTAEKLRPVREDRFYRYLLTHKIPVSSHRWCEKRPFNVRYINEILEYFGSACRFVHIVRDPRAVCTSLHPANPDHYWVSPNRYVQDVSAGLLHIGHPQVYTLKYENLIANLSQEIRKLCDFLEEDLVAEIIDWHQYATVRKNKAWFEGVKRIHQASISRWKAPEHAVRVQEVLSNERIQGLMRRLGYSD